MNRLVREFCVTNVNEYAPFDFAANQLSNNNDRWRIDIAVFRWTLRMMKFYSDYALGTKNTIRSNNKSLVIYKIPFLCIRMRIPKSLREVSISSVVYIYTYIYIYCDQICYFDVFINDDGNSSYLVRAGYHSLLFSANETGANFDKQDLRKNCRREL